MTNISAIFNKDRIKSILKDNTWLNLAIPTEAYNLATPICSEIFNFNFFVSSLDTDKFIADPDYLMCNCEGLLFIHKDYRHNLTGDLRFIKSNKLKKLIC